MIGDAWGSRSFRMRLSPIPAREKGFQRNGKSYPFAGHYDDPSVAFVVPKGFKPGEKIDIVVIFHGHLTTLSEFIVDYGIGKAFGASGRNAILMVPQGPRNAPDSGGGKMEREGGFERLVKEALAALKENKIAGADAEIGNLSVCAYSGGFRPLAHVLHFGGMKDKIREVWLVDAAYDFQDYLAAPWGRAGLDRHAAGGFYGSSGAGIYEDHEQHLPARPQNLGL